MQRSALISSEQEVKELILNISSIIVFFGVGVFCLFRAKQLQNYAVRYYERNPDDAKWVPFLSYVKSATYVTVTRVVGLTTICVALLLAAVLVWFH